MNTRTTPKIAFDDVGDAGPALLLMPGWGGPRTVYRPLLAPLAAHHRVVAIDWRGHGGSETVDGDFGYAGLIDDAVRVLDEAGVDQVIPVGLSHAGWAAIDLRRRLGHARVPAVVLIDWMVLGTPPGFADALAGLQRPESWADVRAALFARWTHGVELPALHAYIAEMAKHGAAMWGRAAREIAARFADEPMPLAVLDREPTPCPTLHVYAQPADPGFLAAQQAYARTHAWFEVHRLEASSHFPPLEVPGELAAQIDTFVRRRVEQPATRRANG